MDVEVLLSWQPAVWDLVTFPILLIWFIKQKKEQKMHFHDWILVIFFMEQQPPFTGAALDDYSVISEGSLQNLTYNNKLIYLPNFCILIPQYRHPGA